MTDEADPVQAAVADLRDMVRRAELLAAYDLASTLLGTIDEQPARTEVAFLAVLALARAGATDRAEELAATMSATPSSSLPTQLACDIAAVRARLAKDRALADDDPGTRPLAMARAAELYAQTFERFGGSYPAINAATTWLLAGDASASRRYAEEALDAIGSESDEWASATRAEAALLLGDVHAAEAAIAEHAAESGGRWAERASTRRQLLLICAAKRLDPALLDPLACPGVCHYTGHRIDPPGLLTPRFDRSHEVGVAQRVARRLAEHRVGFGFGSLASGADIVVAEQLLAAGAELHVVLPFEAEAFVAASVADGGSVWEERFRSCLGSATTVRIASNGEFLGDPAMFDFGAQVAMGEAINHATALGAAVEQIAVWDGVEADEGAEAGTALDVARWRRRGLPTAVIPIEPPIQERAVGALDHPGRRNIRAMLFGDIAGFSKLGDAQLPTFMAGVMAPLGACVASFGDDVLLRKTWGDGLYLVFRDAVAAARCALALQDTMRSIDLDGLGLGELHGLRIGGHTGPAFDGTDPVTGGPSVYGANVTRAARIEPRTPEGEVYVTQPFAALVALGADRDLTCEYVGRLPAAKDYGIMAMYVLKSSRRP